MWLDEKDQENRKHHLWLSMLTKLWTYFRKKTLLSNCEPSATSSCDRSKIPLKTISCNKMISSELSNMDTESLVAAIQAMRQREHAYLPSDYLHRQPYSCGPESVDVECRLKMCSWCIQMVNHCQFNHETVVITMNLLDRFLSKRPHTLLDRSAFQLTAISCLYTTVKVHEPQAIAPETMANLSRGQYTAKQIEATEREILSCLGWLVHPPTALTFSHYLLSLIPCLDKQTRNTLLELTELQTELAVQDYDLCLWNQSLVGFAAVMNALESMSLTTPKVQSQLEVMLSAAAQIDSKSKSKIVHEIRISLYEGLLEDDVEHPKPVCAHNNAAAMHGSKMQHSQPTSPRSVQVHVTQESATYFKQ
jgi:hypothetical protein